MSNVYRIKNGVIWSGIEKIVYSTGQMSVNLIIARLILPEEYALMAMITIFIAIGNIFIDSGFSQALIHKQDRNSEDYSTVFYFNIVVAIFFYLIIYISSPLIADFYNNKIFIPLTRVVSLNLIFSSFSNVQRSILAIRVDFRTQALVSLISVIISGIISILMAYNGYGVWAMVTQTLLVHGIATILLWIFVKWHPIIAFSINSFRQFFSYGSRLLVAKLINTICQNFYAVVIGKIYSPNQVAYFNNANQLSLYSSCYINDIIARALFPILCEKQSYKDKLILLFYKIMSLSSYVIFPVMSGMIVLAEPFVNVILGEKWSGMVVYMQIIAFAYMWYPIMSINQLFNIVGRTDLYLRCEIFKKVAFVIILISTLFVNVTTICYGIVLYNFSEIIITVQLLKSIINITYKGILYSITPSLLLSLVMCLTVATINYYIQSEMLRLILGIVFGIVIYILISLIFKTKNLADIIKILKSKY